MTAALLLFSTAYVLFLDYLAVTDRSLIRALVFPVALFLFIFLYTSRKSLAFYIKTYKKILFLLFGNIFIQLLVISTGGFQSPFLILIHLYMLGLSFLFNFTVSAIFLVFVFIGLFVDLSFFKSIITTVLENPSTIVLQVVSLLTIIPISYIVSRQYHANSLISMMLGTKVKADEKIFASIKEVIIVTDPKLHILSVNDAAERTLLRPKSELLNMPLFEVLLLKNENGDIANQKTFFQKGNVDQPINNTDGFRLTRSTLSTKVIHVQVQSVKDTRGTIQQINFILSDSQANDTSENELLIPLENARVKFEAMRANLKKQLSSNKIQSDFLLLEEIENDIYYTQSIKQAHDDPTPIDTAKLCKQIVELEKDFANVFTVQTDFAILDFGQKDIAPLTVENFPVTPEELTGPFFTVRYDVKLLELYIRKLLHIAILTSSGAATREVHLTIKRHTTDGVVIKVTMQTTNTAPIKEQELPAELALPAGSGLEGVLVKQISKILGVTVTQSSDAAKPSEIVLTVWLPKKATSAPKQ